MGNKIQTSSWFSTLVQNKYRDFVLKPALKIINKHQKFPTFWTMPHDTICRTILLEGYYEKNLLKGMCDLSVNKNGIVLDIGANIGNHTIYFSQFFNKVLAFEPVPSNCWILKANLHLNNIKNVDLIECALSNQSTEMVISSNDGHNTNNGLSPLNAQTDQQSTRVKVYKGDELLNELTLHEKILLIKIDEEGHEPQVIQGLKTTIEKYQPIIFWEAFSLDVFNQSKVILQEFGYTNFYHLSTNKYSNKLANKLFKTFNSSSYLKNIDSDDFTGMNVASPLPLLLD
jgi:FkbM family methyltransferase